MAINRYRVALEAHRAALTAPVTDTAQAVPLLERTSDLLADFEALLEALVDITEGEPHRLGSEELREIVWGTLDLDGAP